MLLSHESRYSLLKYFKYCVLLLTVFINNTKCLNCYICGPVEAGFKQTCDTFHENSSLFIESCKSDQYSCSTQGITHDQVITRQCEELKFDDCKSANGITYCYCSTELCNGILQLTTISYTDDEDLIDGSGIDKIMDEVMTTTILPHSKSISNTFDHHFISTLFSISMYGLARHKIMFI